MPERPPTAAVQRGGGSRSAVRGDGDVGGEAAGADAVLRADERLHGAHGEADLATHLVAAHQRLQPHQPAQRAQGSPGLNTANATLHQVSLQQMQLQAIFSYLKLKLSAYYSAEETFDISFPFFVSSFNGVHPTFINPSQNKINPITRKFIQSEVEGVGSNLFGQVNIGASATITS